MIGGKCKVFFSFFFFFLLACSVNNENEKKQIIEIVDSIGKEAVPDKRIAVWNYEISDTNGILRLKIESDKASGLENLEQQMKRHFPKLKIDKTNLSDLDEQDYTYGLINISAGNIRKGPKHWNELVTQELMGTPVKILKIEDGWILVKTPNGYIGWIDSPAVSLRTQKQVENLSDQAYGIFIRQFGQVFKNNGKTEIVSDLVLADIIRITGKTNTMYKVELPDGREGYVDKKGLVNVKSIFNQKFVDTVQMVKMAKTFMGVSYLWGGKSSKAIDCSGFTSLLYFFQGLILQRDASQQIKYGELVKTNSNFTNFKTGDLLFFGKKATTSAPEKVSHVGIYIGDGIFIHSSGFVRISSLNQSNPYFDKGYYNIFLKARRIANSGGKTGIEKIENNVLYKFFIK